MSYLLQVDFPYQGPWGDEMPAALRGLAESIANEPGLTFNHDDVRKMTAKEEMG